MLGLSFLKGDKAMSEKRRDNRNRILHEGEYQRADGRYRFRYVDIHGNYIVGVWTIMILYLKERKWSFL